MGLNYNEVYTLTCATGNFFPADVQMVALGVRTRVMPEGEVLQFITNDGIGGHQISGEIISEDLVTRVIEVRDDYQTGVMKEPVTWRFVPLTLESFDAMAKDIQGYAEMRSFFATDADLKHYYHVEYLDEESWPEFE